MARLKQLLRVRRGVTYTRLHNLLHGPPPGWSGTIITVCVSRRRQRYKKMRGRFVPPALGYAELDVSEHLFGVNCRACIDPTTAVGRLAAELILTSLCQSGRVHRAMRRELVIPRFHRRTLLCNPVRHRTRQ
jgi:hypothetical protein